mgnify:CR=1 FL=1
MANVHKVLIKGKMPFDVCGRSTDACVRLGLMCSPTYGLKIQYGKSQQFPLKEGGQYTYYDFEISGEEAIWLEIGERSIKSLVEDLVAGGAVIQEVAARDIENLGEGPLLPIEDFPTGKIAESLKELGY